VSKQPPSGPRARADQPGARASQRRRRAARSGRGPVLIAGAIIVLVIVALVVARELPRGEGVTRSADAPVPTPVLADVTSVPVPVANQIGAGSAQNNLVAARGPTLTGPNGHPQVLYVGAEYCPYCAAERWGLVVALSRFGSFSGLKTTTSAADDVDPSTPTFSFYGATYESQYVDFVAVELTTNQKVGGQYQPLQQPTAEQQALLNKYDAAPYVAANAAGSIPFLDIGNQYVLAGASFDPGLLDGKSWEQIAASLKDPSTDTAKAIVGTANYLTAAICQSTNNQPADVCTQPAITQLAATLAKQPTP
jgi:thiol-disulfide isomerase/thioredoxin